MGVGEPKLITWVTMSPASKETCECREFAVRGWRAVVRGAASPRGVPGLSATWMMASCGPLVKRWIRFDGIAGGDDAHEVAGDVDVVRADFAVDDVERAQHDAFGLFDARAGGSAQADAQNGRVDVREDLGADARQEEVRAGRRRRRGIAKTSGQRNRRTTSR